MTKEEAIQLIYNGQSIKCSADEYKNEIRFALQEFAGKMIDRKQDIRAIIVLEEVRRLDEKFNY